MEAHVSEFQEEMTIDDIRKFADGLSANYGYGELIPHDVIDSGLLGVSRSTVAGPHKTIQDLELARVERFKKCRDHLLRNHLKLLRSVRSEGYKVVLPEEQTELAESELYRRVADSASQHKVVVNHVNTDLLTGEDIRRRDASNERAKIFTKLLKKGLREARKGFQDPLESGPCPAEDGE